MRPRAILTLTPTTLIFIAGVAFAETPMSGEFVARQACPAVQSIQKGTNPGDVTLEPSRAYPLLAKNKPQATHYLVDVPGADPSRRWVAADCGQPLVPAGDGGGGAGTGGGDKSAYVLALSWQPAFCELKQTKPECQSQTQGRFDATHFTLHGLWPQPGSNVYCHVAPELVSLDKNSDWAKLPAPNLEDKTRASLDEVMPGTMSHLERHEWIKHGTCFHGDSEEYFSAAVALMAQLNASKVRDLFAGRIGHEVTLDEIKGAFDESFGAGAGDRVRVSCKRDGQRNLIVEVTVGLAGEIASDSSIGELIAASEPISGGCPRGIVDEVGFR